MEQRWMDSESCQHTCNMVYVRLDLAAIDSATMSTITPNTTAMGVCAILALAANVVCLSVIIKRAIEQKKNPYKEEIFAGTKDFVEAMERAE